MAKDGRTEKATPQRRKKARDEGTVARSQEVAVAASFAALVGILALTGPNAVRQTQGHFSEVFRTAGNADALAASGPRALQMVIVLAGPFLAGAVLAGVAAGVSQVGFKVNMKLAKPKLKNLSPKKGLEKLKPVVASWELIRSMVKLGAVAVVVWPTLSTWQQHLQTDRTLDGAIQRLSGVYGTIILRAAVLALAIAAADYAYQKWRTNTQMKMSHHDIKREHKDSEGDPLVRAQRRRRASELSRNRMMRDVATADVLITNPTHLCVALRYDPAEGAPRVVAKGADLVADKLKSVARRHGVPITPNVPLARALFKQCKVGHHVPAALYEAVAVVLATAYRRSGRGPGSRLLQRGAA
ncbi:flagellar biosynthesis protein FlhB [Egicoccus sp. AB-alg6-2]|uniref:EscU/YscU/HrcU family type III secretion system export apparatus switch protein n=1 Tax=Egicoccus sp. AB-alg6-2 TaxID=3242692 RepID=UPI00359D7A17